MTVAPPPRRRAPQLVQPPKPRHPWDVPVVGGPKISLGTGSPVFTEGTPTKSWPYRTGSDFIGYFVDEYQHTKTKAKVFYGGTDIQHVHTHAWQFREGSLRYIGSFPGRDAACGRIKMLWERAKAGQVQRVAPPPRKR